MSHETPAGAETIDSVEIDYDRLDVTAIMDQVKRIAAARPAPPGREEAAPTGFASPAGAGPEPAGAAGPPGRKARLKAKLLRAMTPFFPVIRLFALPLHEEIQAVVKHLDETNRRVDFLFGRLEDLDRSMEYIKLLHSLDHNLVVEVTKLRIELDGLRSRARLLEKDLEHLGRRERALEGRVRE